MSSIQVCTSVLSPRTELEHQCMKSWRVKSWRVVAGQLNLRMNTPTNNLGVTGSLQWHLDNTQAEILCYLHSDVEIFEPGWDQRVLREFDDPTVGVVGFGGGLQHGSQDIYRVPYRLEQLARGGYISNTRDAESHGGRFAGSADVAVLDGFCLAIRRSLLTRAGGWPVSAIPFHCYDYFACIEAHRQGMKVRMVGVDCQHHGGHTSTRPEYQDWSQRVLGKSDAQVHEDSHRWLYDNSRGLLPWRCPTHVIMGGSAPCEVK